MFLNLEAGPNRALLDMRFRRRLRAEWGEQTILGRGCQRDSRRIRSARWLRERVNVFAGGDLGRKEQDSGSVALSGEKLSVDGHGVAESTGGPVKLADDPAKLQRRGEGVRFVLTARRAARPQNCGRQQNGCEDSHLLSPLQ